MKAPRLTWLHSCLLGRRRHDYRAETVLPPSLAWTNTLFKETEWTRDERPGSARPQLLLLFCWCCCFWHRGCRLFNRCYLWGLCDLYRLLLRCCSRTQDYVSVSYSIVGLEPDVFHLPQMLSRPVSCLGLQWISSSLTLGSLHLCDLCSLLTAMFQSPLSSKLVQSGPE